MLLPLPVYAISAGGGGGMLAVQCWASRAAVRVVCRCEHTTAVAKAGVFGRPYHLPYSTLLRAMKPDFFLHTIYRMPLRPCRFRSRTPRHRVAHSPGGQPAAALRARAPPLHM